MYAIRSYYEHAALLIHIGVDLLRAHAGTFHQERDDRGIDAATAGAHRHAFERSESHGSIHALSAFDRGEAGTVAEMARDHTGVFLFHAKSDKFFDSYNFV